MKWTTLVDLSHGHSPLLLYCPIQCEHLAHAHNFFFFRSWHLPLSFKGCCGAERRISLLCFSIAQRKQVLPIGRPISRSETHISPQARDHGVSRCLSVQGLEFRENPTARLLHPARPARGRGCFCRNHSRGLSRSARTLAVASSHQPPLVCERSSVLHIPPCQ